MIYVSKGFETNQLTEIESNENDLQTIIDSKVQVFTNVDELEYIKRHKAYYFLSGELSELIRKNESVMKKSLVVLDYDDVGLSEEEFKAHLLNKINSLKFYAYPSISHGLNGTRFRVIISIDRPYIKEESKELIQFITSQIDLSYDEASETWSQPMGLKVTFDSVEAFNDKCIYNKGIGVLKVDNALAKMAERKPKKKKTELSFKSKYSNTKKFTASFMEELLAGVDDGNRDNWTTKQFGRMLSLGFDYTTAYIWIELINREFVRPPLEDKEINRIVLSIANKEKTKFEKAREG